MAETGSPHGDPVVVERRGADDQFVFSVKVHFRCHNSVLSLSFVTGIWSGAFPIPYFFQIFVKGQGFDDGIGSALLNNGRIYARLPCYKTKIRKLKISRHTGWISRD
jgi:hypothetical protein